jgi:hypothetical protein
MCLPLDELHQQYFAMLRDGLAPTGLVLEYGLLKLIGLHGRRSDPRIQWSESGPERLFGFKPQFVLSGPPRFTLPGGHAARSAEERDYTLRELRAL